MAGFVRSGSARRYAAGLRAVLDLGAGCVDDFARLQERADLELRQTGLLMTAVAFWFMFASPARSYTHTP